MADTVETPEVDPATAETAPPKANADSRADGSGRATAPSNKEARYRVERNEARAERDSLAQRVERMQRAEVERIASDALSHPADIFSLSGNAVADYLDDAGNIDPERVAADVAAVLSERPGLRKAAAAFDPTQGTGGRDPRSGPTTWGEFLNPLT